MSCGTSPVGCASLSGEELRRSACNPVVLVLIRQSGDGKLAHERKSELNRLQQDGVVPETPYGLPTDDLHPDGEAHARSTPPGAPEPGTKLDPNATIDWGEAPGEEVVVENPKKPGEAA